MSLYINCSIEKYKDISWDMWNYLKDRSHRIEVFYEDASKKNSGILTRVYFPFAPSVHYYINTCFILSCFIA